jgi:hypothetical protein
MRYPIVASAAPGVNHISQRVSEKDDREEPAEGVQHANSIAPGGVLALVVLFGALHGKGPTGANRRDLAGEQSQHDPGHLQRVEQVDASAAIP